VVVLKFEYKMRKMVVVGENELDYDFEMNWCYNLMFVVVVLNAF